MAKSAYKRILLKVSGEVLAGDQSFGIEPEFLHAMARTDRRGRQDRRADRHRHRRRQHLPRHGRRRQGRRPGDRRLMGMLGTVINSLALWRRHRRGPAAKVQGILSVPMPTVADTFTARAAKAALDDGFVVVCAGGTGNPFFTTDTAAALKAIELRLRRAAQGHQGRWGLFRRSQEEPDGAALRPDQLRRGDLPQSQGHGHGGLRPCPRQRLADNSFTHSTTRKA